MSMSAFVPEGDGITASFRRRDEQRVDTAPLLHGRNSRVADIPHIVRASRPLDAVGTVSSSGLARKRPEAEGSPTRLRRQIHVPAGQRSPTRFITAADVIFPGPGGLLRPASNIEPALSPRTMLNHRSAALLNGGTGYATAVHPLTADTASLHESKIPPSPTTAVVGDQPLPTLRAPRFDDSGLRAGFPVLDADMSVSILETGSVKADKQRAGVDIAQSEHPEHSELNHGLDVPSMDPLRRAVGQKFMRGADVELCAPSNIGNARQHQQQHQQRCPLASDERITAVSATSSDGTSGRGDAGRASPSTVIAAEVLAAVSRLNDVADKYPTPKSRPVAQEIASDSDSEKDSRRAVVAQTPRGHDGDPDHYAPDECCMRMTKAAGGSEETEREVTSEVESEDADRSSTGDGPPRSPSPGGQGGEGNRSPSQSPVRNTIRPTAGRQLSNTEAVIARVEDIKANLQAKMDRNGAREIEDALLGEGREATGKDSSHVLNLQVRQDAARKYIANLQAEAAAIRNGTHPAMLRHAQTAAARGAKRRRAADLTCTRQKMLADTLFQDRLHKINLQRDEAVAAVTQRVQDAVSKQMRELRKGAGIKDDTRVATRLTRASGPPSQSLELTFGKGGKRPKSPIRFPLGPMELVLDDDDISDDVSMINTGKKRPRDANGSIIEDPARVVSSYCRPPRAGGRNVIAGNAAGTTSEHVVRREGLRPQRCRRTPEVDDMDQDAEGDEDGGGVHQRREDETASLTESGDPEDDVGGVGISRLTYSARSRSNKRPRGGI